MGNSDSTSQMEIDRRHRLFTVVVKECSKHAMHKTIEHHDTCDKITKAFQAINDEDEQIRINKLRSEQIAQLEKLEEYRRRNPEVILKPIKSVVPIPEIPPVVVEKPRQTAPVENQSTVVESKRGKIATYFNEMKEANEARKVLPPNKFESWYADSMWNEPKNETFWDKPKSSSIWNNTEEEGERVAMEKKSEVDRN